MLHGPLCISNADGSQQEALTELSVKDGQPTLWIGNRLFFIDVDDELTSENDNGCRTSLFTIDPSTNKPMRMFSRVRCFAIKQPVFSFNKFPNVNKKLGPEMKSTGESILFIDSLKDDAFYDIYTRRKMYLSK